MKNTKLAFVAICLFIFSFISSCSKDAVPEHPVSGVVKENNSGQSTALAGDRESCGWVEVPYTVDFGTFSWTSTKWIYKPCSPSSLLTSYEGGGIIPTWVSQPQPFFEAFPLASDFQNISNLDALMECMKPKIEAPGGDEFEIGIYVEQPIPGFPYAYSNFPNSLQCNFGRTYLYIRKKDGLGTEELVLSYLPEAPILGNTAPYSTFGPAKIVSPNGAFPCNIACKQVVTRMNYIRVLNRVKAYLTQKPTYNVVDSNGADFVLSVTEPLGWGLNPAAGELPDHQYANCAGVLGERIRALGSGTGIQIPNGIQIVLTEFIPLRAGTCL